MSKNIERRRNNAKTMLEEQLVRGTKPEKVNKKTTSKMIPLTEGDKIRIKKDIEILSSPRKKKTKA
jgi:hypothetical protein